MNTANAVEAPSISLICLSGTQSISRSLALTRLVELPGMRLGNAVIQMLAPPSRAARPSDA